MKTVVVGPPPAELRWFSLAGTAYEETGVSALSGTTAAELAGQIQWPGAAPQ